MNLASPSVIRTIAELRERVADTRERQGSVALVPTMGALHEGHLSLVRQARAAADLVVVSLFVNPTQFNEARDLAAYPRDEEKDAVLAASAGCDVLFVPAVSEIYPDGFGTSIDVGSVALPLEGEARGPAHFRGVATVVAKLLNIVQPDTAFFGQKDAQQTLVIKRLVRDLDMRVRVEVSPTVREPGGLAMSSRNQRLSPDARERARGLFEALGATEDKFASGEREALVLEAAGRNALAARGITAKDIDYFAVSDMHSLARLRRVETVALVSLAVQVDGVRLIDNTVLGT